MRYNKKKCFDGRIINELSFYLCVALFPYRDEKNVQRLGNVLQAGSSINVFNLANQMIYYARKCCKKKSVCFYLIDFSRSRSA